jgi:hypothetical protein
MDTEILVVGKRLVLVLRERSPKVAFFKNSKVASFVFLC